CQPKKKIKAGTRYGQVRAARPAVATTPCDRVGRATAALTAIARPRHLSSTHDRVDVLRLLELGVDGVLGGEQRLLGVLLVAGEVLLPVRLADHELLEAELVRVDRPARLQLLEHERAPLRKPARRMLRPAVPEREVRG